MANREAVALEVFKMLAGNAQDRNALDDTAREARRVTELLLDSKREALEEVAREATALVNCLRDPRAAGSVQRDVLRDLERALERLREAS